MPLIYNKIGKIFSTWSKFATVVDSRVYSLWTSVWKVPLENLWSYDMHKVFLIFILSLKVSYQVFTLFTNCVNVVTLLDKTVECNKNLQNFYEIR